MRSTSHSTRRRIAFAAVATALLCLITAGRAEALESAWAVNPESRVRLLSPYRVAPADGPWRLGLEFETEPGWHVYWKNSGDAGYPPAIDFGATPGVSGAELSWPAPERYLLPGDLEAFGYEGRVTYPLELTIRPAGESVTLTADLDYLVCEVDCIPYRYRLTLEQPVAAAGEPAVADEAAARHLAEWEARRPRPVGEVGATTEAAVDLSTRGAPRLEVRVTGAQIAPGALPELFLDADEVFDFGIPQRLAGAGDDLLFSVPATFWQVPEPMPAAVELGWTVTGLLDGDAPLAIEARRPVPLQFGGLAPVASERPHPSLPRLAILLAVALLGGFLLHLTPTLLPLSVAHGWSLVAEPPDPARSRRAALATAGGSFVGAMALAGLAVAAGGRRMVTWGTQLQEPSLVALLAVAATLLTLGLWGLFDWPLQRPGGEGGHRRRTARGLGTGLAAALLALPWILPPLPESIGPALAGGAVAGGLTFAALGLGLALPWLAVAARPTLLAHLRPASAETARRVTEGLGFLAATAVLWLLYLLSRQLSSDGLALLELLLLCVALVAWVRATARRRLLATALAVVLAVLAVATVWVADSRRLVPRGGGTAATAAPLVLAIAPGPATDRDLSP